MSYYKMNKKCLACMYIVIILLYYDSYSNANDVINMYKVATMWRIYPEYEGYNEGEYELYKNTQLCIYKSPEVISMALKRAKSNIDYEWIYDNINVHMLNNSQIMEATIICDNPNDVIDLFESINEEYIINSVHIERTRILKYISEIKNIRDRYIDQYKKENDETKKNNYQKKAAYLEDIIITNELNIVKPARCVLIMKPQKRKITKDNKKEYR